ncbi:transposase [Bradyrhizobium sp. GM24.11]
MFEALAKPGEDGVVLSIDSTSIKAHGVAPAERAYKGRNVIERCFCRLKDFRRIATRYDKLARNFLAAVHLAALVAYWLN